MNKNLLKPQVLIALLAAGTMAFHSCKDKNEVIQDDPGATTPAESVKTQFAINIPAAGNKQKMTDANTQQTGVFIGMQNIKLLPLTTAATDGIALNQIISLGNIGNGELNGQQKIYSDINVPVQTTNFLFYGEALGTQTTATTNAFEQGVLNNTLGTSATTNDISFKLLPVTTNKNYDATNAVSKTNVLTAVNNVAGAKGWKDYATAGTGNQLLINLYNKFITQKAGSAASVQLTLADLKNNIASLLSDGGDAGAIANAINTAIETAIGTDGNGGTLAGNTYPTDFNLPEGAAQLTWDADGKASYVEDASFGTTTTVSLDIAKICYPASLNYFVSTGLKSTESSSPTWPTYNDWAAGTWGSEWTGTSVVAATKAIALTSPIQYGVALLETAVKCKTQTLEDNAIAAGGETQNRIITVPSAGFTVTGLLIGGQPDALKWNFKPASDGDRTMTIYDNAVTSVTAGYNIAETKNYTLVLENTKTSGDADVVNVAIEMENNSGGDFYGADGIIKKDATFYLIGKLDLNNLGSGNNNSGRTSVFEQDYTTVATFTISSLKSAYNCIPDLRASQLSLGLAVDLSWKAGVVFDVTID